MADVQKLVADSQRKSRPDLVLFVDPRSEPEFRAAHVAGARNILLSGMPLNSPVDKSIGRYDNIVVYGTDPSSAPARGMTKRLLSIGYDDVYLLEGGLLEWETQGGEVVRTVPAQPPQ